MISIRRSIGALVLVVGSGLLWSGCATSGKLEHGADCAGIKNHNIEIGSVVSCKWVYLNSNSTGQGNTVNWRATDPNRTVIIQFDSAHSPDPFPSISCRTIGQNVCHSGSLDPSIQGDSSKEYPYNAYLCDAQGAHCDMQHPIEPGIIIVPSR